MRHGTAWSSSSKWQRRKKKKKFFDLVKKGNIGLSANYLNFNDLADCKYLKEKIHTIQEICGEKGIQIKTAMIADIMVSPWDSAMP